MMLKLYGDKLSRPGNILIQLDKIILFFSFLIS
jgi:hypothetical protein